MANLIGKIYEGTTTTRHCYMLNISAVCLMLSEKIVLFCFVCFDALHPS